MSGELNVHEITTKLSFMEENKNNKRKLIRNSTAEFLMFQLDNKEQGIEVYYKDETLWMTQKAMSVLFDCSTDNIGLHLKNIYSDGELLKEATTEDFSVVRKEGDRNVTRNLLFYNLDAVISTGYRKTMGEWKEYKIEPIQTYGMDAS